MYSKMLGVGRYARRIIARLPLGASCACNICGKRVQRFLPYRGGSYDIPPLMQELGVTGSDIENHECPACGCHDRERHLFMYLTATGILKKLTGARILHIAPEGNIQNLIQKVLPLEYVMGDLYPNSEKVRQINIQAMPFDSEYFDLVIANHVMEHVEDDHKALREIVRVLRTGGQAILQTPYSTHLTKTFEDSGIRSPLARLHAYGQEDHQRLYARDIVERFHSAGLHGYPVMHSAVLPNIDHRRYGVNYDEPFMLFYKPSQ